ncbi:MAG: hypothetical protein V1755_05500 [Chloroflexota bacterium]
MDWKNRIVELRYVPPGELRANPSNWRTHPAQQRGALDGVLSEIGVVMPWLLNQRSEAAGWPAGSESHLIDGHLRTDMAVESGQAQVPVIVVDLSELEERMVLASLDPIGALATTNAEKLKEVIAGLSTRSKGLEQLIDKQRRLVQRLTTEGAHGDGNTKASLPDELAKKWGTAAGQLWRIPSIAGPGEHRILCGDSTSMADMDRLCGDMKPKLLATDPPYLVDYNGGNHPDKHHFSKSGRMSTVTKEWDAYIDPEASVDFYRDFLRVALAHCDDNIAVYQWHASRRQHLVHAAWEANNIIEHQQVIWRKNSRC